MESDFVDVLYLASRELLVRILSFTATTTIILLLISASVIISRHILVLVFSLAFALWGMYIWRVIAWIRISSKHYWEQNTPPYTDQMPDKVPILDLIVDLLNESFSPAESSELAISHHKEAKLRAVDNFGLGGLILLISLTVGGLILENGLPAQIPNVPNSDVSSMVALAAALLGSVYGSIIVIISSLSAGNIPNEATIALASFVPPMIFFAVALRNIVWLLECGIRDNIERHRSKEGVLHSTTATVVIYLALVPVCFSGLFVVMGVIGLWLGM